MQKQGTQRRRATVIYLYPAQHWPLISKAGRSSHLKEQSSVIGQLSATCQPNGSVVHFAETG